MLQVRCPHCSHEWQAPERLRGTNKRCPSCRKLVTLVESSFYEQAAGERRRLVEGARKTIPVGCVIHNVRSAYNVGSMMRSADGAGVCEVVVVGITPDPSSPRVAKTSLGAEESVPWFRLPSLEEAAEYFRSKGFRVVAAEALPSAACTPDDMPGPPIAFVFGNEVSGLSREAIGMCDACVGIPMLGAKVSLNVSVAAGILFYKALEKWRREA
ncbi:MAG: TrmH family RNA methyltransferase [Planctomycetes bacterium]|nr:TrmH family RNA methyltransferase [Planctomycetota bacterium]